jgi:hypothetical protein
MAKRLVSTPTREVRDDHVCRPPTRARTCTGLARPTQSGSVRNRLASASGAASIGAYATPLTASWTWFCHDSPAKPGPVRSMWSRRNTPAGYGAGSPSERRRASWTPTCMPGTSGRARTAGTPARAAGQDRDHRRGCGRSAPKARCQLRAADTRQAAAAACAAGSCSCTALAACRAGSSRLPDAPWHHATTVSPTAQRQRTSPHGRHGRRKRRRCVRLWGYLVPAGDIGPCRRAPSAASRSSYAAARSCRASTQSPA